MPCSLSLLETVRFWALPLRFLVRSSGCLSNALTLSIHPDDGVPHSERLMSPSRVSDLGCKSTFAEIYACLSKTQSSSLDGCSASLVLSYKWRRTPKGNDSFAMLFASSKKLPQLFTMELLVSQNCLSCAGYSYHVYSIRMPFKFLTPHMHIGLCFAPNTLHRHRYGQSSSSIATEFWRKRTKTSVRPLYGRERFTFATDHSMIPLLPHWEMT
jgi:hypothetical protein